MKPHHHYKHNIMIDILVIALVLAVIVGLLWVIQPYKNWKKNFDARQYEPISITDQQRKKYTLQ